MRLKGVKGYSTFSQSGGAPCTMITWRNTMNPMERQTRISCLEEGTGLKAKLFYGGEQPRKACPRIIRCWGNTVATTTRKSTVALLCCWDAHSLGIKAAKRGSLQTSPALLPTPPSPTPPCATPAAPQASRLPACPGLQSTGSHRAGHRTEHTGAHSDPRSLMPCSRYSGSEYVSKN